VIPLQIWVRVVVQVLQIQLMVLLLLMLAEAEVQDNILRVLEEMSQWEDLAALAAAVMEVAKALKVM
jgi:hypothetical protein